MCNKMSDVRLSASPTLERVDARQQDSVRPPVRRNLFGTPDREEIQRYLAATIQEDVQDFREEYNFDPVTERPLTPRNYEWQEDTDAPEFYRRGPHGSERPERNVHFPGQNLGPAAVESSQADRGETRKRRSGDTGQCSSESHGKRSHTDEDDDDEDESKGAASLALQAEEQSASRPDGSAEVQ
ncbi:uncharacterized protein V6R79_003017 [Siganus canaliculatus]